VKIAIVGGGTAGYITALILKEYLNCQVDVIQSSKIGIIGVGEGSTEHFSEFMKFVGINHDEIIKECDATYKSGIMFEGWTKEPYLHNVAYPLNNKYSSYSHIYASQIANNEKQLTPIYTWENRIQKTYLNRDDSPHAQFHFNTFKLNEFFQKKCTDRGIFTFDDEIKEVIVDETGSIKNIRGEVTTYEYDFYVDSTGFKRLLIGKLGAKWESFDKHLKMKAAVTFPTEDKDNYNIWTLAKAMDNGWMFRLPVWGRYGNGYIFDSDYTDMDSVKKELQEYFKKDLDFGREFQFDAGAINTPWINNCVAIGLSSIFVEPLEASSIGSSINQAFMLMHRILGYTQSSIDTYNKSFTEMAYNIRDFIALHYITDRRDTEFWRNIAKVDLPDSLALKLEHWRNHLPIPEDFAGSSRYSLFTDSHYILVMHGLGLFNVESIKKEFNSLPEHVKDNARYIIKNSLMVDERLTTPHKEHLRLIREVF
jgi:flavin-dependent dehydrogenase